MKKWLSIIGAIGLTVTSTTTLISCEKRNNNENRGNNKPELSYNTQQPPENSNWKLIDKNDRENEFLKPNNKWYFYVRQFGSEYKYEKFYFDDNFIKNKNTHWQHLKNGTDFIWKNNSVYCFSGSNEPQIPTIDKNTGEITDWKEQKGTK
ncbi:Spiroplasmavirus-related protein [Spiroplasma kunkelii CR2-3x]|uniref:Spiroplasmavirus-related protein n=1 Tax=Spiroplasma kunkelii CR2-3x TaxID=273035 RepID=A0A0K2JGU1_SPIKU|nr:lipoprotein [Spiroplasma kunkelii]ALA97795.1 Spiroplasmavirus-related protein [Spiroplasma kunkelii CR2-3x]